MKMKKNLSFLCKKSKISSEIRVFAKFEVRDSDVFSF